MSKPRAFNPNSNQGLLSTKPGPPLPASFYLQPTLQVARSLLGCYLWCDSETGPSGGRIVETEAYLGSKDPASHAYRGPTKRSQTMFGLPGRAYIYFTYGKHYCFNVVTQAEGLAEAVLIRALEPAAGINLMQARRQQAGLLNLASGPAKLVQALGILPTMNGLPLDTPPLFIGPGEALAAVEISSGPRVGISQAKDQPWRFWVAGNPYVSAYKALRQLPEAKLRRP